VLHAGIYYPTGSLRARLCVAGRRTLTARLAAWRVPHRIGGKLIVAVEPGELAELERLQRQGLENGVEELPLLDGAAARRREPNIRAQAALFSPGAGVFDVGEYLHELAGRAQAAGALLVPDARVEAIDLGAGAIGVRTRQKGEVRGRFLINAAGLDADEIARLCGEDRHTIHPCRGEYAAAIPRRAGLINELVYPVPEDVSIGVHFTRTVAGELWLGPDARFIESKNDYESGRRPPADFLAAAQRLCPAFAAADLRLGPSGIRPKRTGPGEPQADFFIECQPGEPRVLHLVGIESPGLTASPAIAKMAAEMVDERL